jgi:hypothetical protein
MDRVAAVECLDCGRVHLFYGDRDDHTCECGQSLDHSLVAVEQSEQAAPRFSEEASMMPA